MLTQGLDTFVAAWLPRRVIARRPLAALLLAAYVVVPLSAVLRRDRRTRLMQSESGHPILLVAGMDPRDTQAAVEFFSNGRYLDPFVKTMPADWANKSFQAVLHNTIHGNSPGSLTVVASAVW